MKLCVPPKADSITRSELIRTVASDYQQLRAAIAVVADFLDGNGPYGERDFGAFELFGQKLFWKVDYYDPDQETCALIPVSNCAAEC